MMNILPMPKVTVGDGVINEIPTTLAAIHAKNIMVVTDKGVIGSGIYDKLKHILESTGHNIILCDRVKSDPSIKLIQEIVDIARGYKLDAVIGLGGGSAMDAAKLAAALMKNPKNVHQYIGIDLLENDSLPIIAIPTTAGTGSEVTHIAILSDEDNQLKKGIVSAKIMPDYAYLDPSLTLCLPKKITAESGMDALCHALESYTSVNATQFSQSLSLTAMQILGRNIVEAYQHRSNIKAREQMLVGSLFAGIAFAHAGVTAVHVFAYPLGGMFHVPHGLANSLMLPTIIKYNAVGNEQSFTEVAQAITGDPKATAQTAIEAVEKFSVLLELPKNLAAIDIPEDSIPAMAKGAMEVTRLLVNNPRKIEYQDAVTLYEQAYSREYVF